MLIEFDVGTCFLDFLDKVEGVPVNDRSVMII
jgi:hypothetical protein